MFGLRESLFGRRRERAACSPALASASGSATPAKHPRRWVANVLCLIDVSWSVGQEALDHVFDQGLPCVLERLRQASGENDIVYQVSVLSFGSETREIIPFGDARTLALSPEQRLECSGVTMMEQALWEAFARIDEQKARQDERREPRAGSRIIVVTDGRNTDENGHPKALSPELVNEIRERNETRSTSTFVIGMGEADDETLLQLGPVLRETLEGGQRVEAPRAVRYVGDDYRSRQCWEAVCSLIGQASSSSTGKPFVVDSVEAAADLPDYAEVIELDRSAFRVVR